MTFSLSDCYGLGLIAKYPNKDWTDVVTHMGSEARQVADQIMHPGHAPRDIQKAAKELVDLAGKVRSTEVI
jgi:hypothetical protein